MFKGAKLNRQLFILLGLKGKKQLFQSLSGLEPWRRGSQAGDVVIRITPPASIEAPKQRESRERNILTSLFPAL